MPAELFGPMRIREYGDCEDVSWEAVENFRDLLALPVGANTELGKLKHHAQNYSCLMSLVSATQADATSKSNKNNNNYMAHMVCSGPSALLVSWVLILYFLRSRCSCPTNTSKK